MRGLLRFPFTAADQSHLTVTGLIDEPMMGQPLAGAPYPQSLRLDLESTAAAPPRVLPLFSGQFGFMRLGDGLRPSPEQVTSTAYSSWGTVGRLWVRPTGRRAARQLATELAALPVVPNRVFLEPVRLPEDFLFETLVQHLPKRTIRAGNRRVRPSDGDWAEHAISAFIAGDYWPISRVDEDEPDLDDVVTHPWPHLVIGAVGAGSLWIGLAKRSRRPQDVGRRDLLGAKSWADPDLPYQSFPTSDPANPRYGAIPARVVYQHMADNLIDGENGLAVADALRAAPADYRRLQFTRTWLPGPTESVYFPLLTAAAQTADGNEHYQRMPHHGWVWVPADPGEAVNVALVSDYNYSWLRGATPDAWQQPAAQDPVALPAGEEHVIVRRPFSQEILVERAFAPRGARCTYMTIRRFVRALIEHRITGGLLNHRWKRNAARVRDLMDQAWQGHAASGTFFWKNQPPPRAQDGDEAGTKLRLALHAFYPDAPSGGYSRGEAAYWLWQSAYGHFGDPSMEGLLVGYGGPAAAEDLGAAVLAYDPAPTPQEEADHRSWLNRVFDDATTSLQPPALLQFWTSAADFLRLRRGREDPIPSKFPFAAGHSLLFIAYETDDQGTVSSLVKVDQYGEGELPVTHQIVTVQDNRIAWDGEPRDVWIAANVVDLLME